MNAEFTKWFFNEYVYILEVWNSSYYKLTNQKNRLNFDRNLYNVCDGLRINEFDDGYLRAGLVKIIKKHDKKTGALLRVPFIQDVVKQPFYEIDVINKLVKECEVLSILFTNGSCSSMGQDFMENGFGSVSINENEETVMQVPDELSDLKNMKNMYIELTLSALHTLEQIRGRNSNENMFSSPSPHN